METMLERSYRVSGAVVNIAAAGVGNAANIFLISAFAQQIGTKSFVPKKIRVRNVNGGNLWLFLGTGAGGGFAPQIPAVRVLNLLDNIWQEFDLPKVDFFATMTAYPDALIAGGTVDVQVEVEETG